jgi:hypothetical protein
MKTEENRVQKKHMSKMERERRIEMRRMTLVNHFVLYVICVNESGCVFMIVV